MFIEAGKHWWMFFKQLHGLFYRVVSSIAAAIAADHALLPCAGKAAAGKELCRHKQH